MVDGGNDRSGTATRRRIDAAVALARPAVDALARLLGPDGREAARLRRSVAAERIGDELRRELDAGLALPGLVVVFALGIVLYFRLPREPWLPAILALAGASAAVVVVRRRAGHAARLAAVIAALVFGVAAASLACWRVAAPRLDHERTVTVEGRVTGLDGTERGGVRLAVDVVRMEGRGLTAETTPRRITATLAPSAGRPEVGAGIRFKARLKPPEGPVLPGGYDFARRAWFEGRGAGGYVLGRWTAVDLGPATLGERLVAPIGGLRHAIAERVRASLPGPTGTIAAALMVGEQRAIPESVAEPLRASGLTHIVSISGLHMGLVAGGVLVAVRAVLALFPMLALGFPIKKWAAAAAFAAATGYLLLAGDQVAALRSHLMLSVALFAVMVDRPAITMHTVAVSAALILAVEPWSVMEPSFQMSYLAVIALVAAYDLFRRFQARRPPPTREAGPLGHLFGAGMRQIEGFAFSSLVAGLATAPVIVAVFHRAATYSILANMAVLPVTGLVIMPAAVVAALAMPFGLDPWPLQAMGLGIDWMIAVGRWAAALPAGGGLVGAPHAATMPLGILAVLWLSAWTGRIRLLGLLPAVAAIGLVFAGPRPDVIVGRHGSAVAVRDGAGRLHVLAGRQERFDVAIWLAADGDARGPGDPTLGEGWRCDGIGCVFRLAVAPHRAAVAPPGAGRGSADVGVGRGSGGEAVAARVPAGGPSPGGSAGRDAIAAGRREPAAGLVDRGSVAERGHDGVGSGGAAIDLVDRGSAAERGHDAAGSTEAAAGLVDRRSVAERGHDGVGPGERRVDGVIEIAVVRHPAGFEEDCRRAAVVITTLVAPPGCRDHATVIDRLDLALGGATTLAFDGPPRPKRSVDPRVVRLDQTEARRTVDPTAEEKAQEPQTADDPERDLGPRAVEDPGGGLGARTADDPGGGLGTRPADDPGGPADSATALDPIADAAADGRDPPALTRSVRVIASLPRPARPWTPIDPSATRLEQEAEAAQAAATAAALRAPGAVPRAGQGGPAAATGAGQGTPAAADGTRASAGARPLPPAWPADPIDPTDDEAP